MTCIKCGAQLDPEAHRLQVDTTKIPAIVGLAFPQVGKLLARVELFRCPVGCGVSIHYPDDIPGLLPRP